MHSLQTKKIATHFHYFSNNWGVYKKSVLTLLIATGGYALTFLLNSILAHALTPVNYGEITAILATATLFTAIILLGNDEASVKFIPDYLSQKDYAHLHRLIRYYYRYVAALCLLLFIIFVGISVLLANSHLSINITVRYLWITPILAMLTFFMMILRSLNAANSSLLTYSILPCLLFAICLELFIHFSGTITLRNALFIYVAILV